ncbi:hypothetical protein Avbf_14307 [Armadillidium vulgare]|nr:hypothetical protein Avbf_14307 [Armadillidium vulgare]
MSREVESSRTIENMGFYFALTEGNSKELGHIKKKRERVLSYFKTHRTSTLSYSELNLFKLT